MRRRLATTMAELDDDVGAIGIACGPVIPGVIGHRKFAYDVWGDTVNMASRLESAAMPGSIQVSQPV